MNNPNCEVRMAARAKVAERFSATYNRNAILRGEWDTGTLVQEAERELLMNAGKEETHD